MKITLEQAALAELMFWANHKSARELNEKLK